jgi:predicted amidohydrolase
MAEYIMLFGYSITFLYSIACIPKEKQQTHISSPILQSPPISTNTKPTILVQKNGSYPTIPLEKEEIVLSIIQSNAKPIKDISQAEEILRSNSEHMIEMGREACSADLKPDIILFHEFPLSGYFFGNRDKKLQMAIEIPGDETNALALLAKECDAYVVFGAYAKDSAWPGHVLSINTILDRQGNIRKKVWKPRNIKRFYPTFEISTTTVESVQERFREKYGIDDEFPVVQTEFGNISVSTAQLDPLVFNVFGMKGAEIMLRTSTLFFQSDIIHTSMVNNFYSAMANIPYDSPYGGQSIVVSPSGKVLTQIESRTEEGFASIKIPIAEFRKNRRLPQYSVAFTRSVFSQYIDEIPPNHLDVHPSTLPQNGKEMKVLIDKKSRWLKDNSETSE